MVVLKVVLILALPEKTSFIYITWTVKVGVELRHGMTKKVCEDLSKNIVLFISTLAVMTSYISIYIYKRILWN